RSGGPDWAVAPNRTWILPGRNVESDFALANDMVEAVNIMQFDAVAHEQEHAIEVQLPIIARLSPHTKVVGVVMHSEQWDVIQEEAIQFANLLLRLPQLPMLIISTDMNHYASEEATREVDKIALDAVKTLNPRTLLDVVVENRISMCGVTPAVFVLETLRQMNMLNECVQIGYTTSAQRSGDRNRVVGYAGMLFR
ncbi:MAG: AmmeMemoRadiSam system protein B, partial [Thermoguttaceae bacterium]